jgi:hypothetical protein
MEKAAAPSTNWYAPVGRLETKSDRSVGNVQVYIRRPLGCPLNLLLYGKGLELLLLAIGSSGTGS